MSGSETSVYASFTRRCLAHLIDLSLVLAACGLFYLANLLLGSPVRYSAIFGFTPPLSFEMFMSTDFPGIALTYLSIKLFLTYPYSALMESSRWQGTLGKLAVGIKVTDVGGQRISFGKATARFFLKSMSAFLLMLGYVLSFSDQKQTWHDYMTKVLVVRRNIFPAFYALPRSASRWLFDWPTLGRRRSADEACAPLTGYLCLFCHYRSSEKHTGCPNCGMPFGYGEAGAMRALELMHGIVFTSIGCFALYEGVRLCLINIQETVKIPWWAVAFLFAFGGLFASGGLSAFFGRNWLIRWLLLFLTRV